MQCQIRPEHISFMNQQGETSYPHECCGFLLGRQSATALVVSEVVPAENRRIDSLHNRYDISPSDYMQTEKLADSRGLQIVGFYHSHPDHPAIPSQYDLEHAWPTLAYVIVSVRNGKAGDVCAFVLAEDRSRFDQIEVKHK
ncbi:MAG: Mov34/MPN/PAD-1 family protein [bacterium]